MNLPDNLKPATWGCSHGGGWLGQRIRHAEMEMSHGDKEASWAGHCFIFIGDYNFGHPGIPDIRPAIVEAEYPKVIVSPADKHEDAIWATGQPLTPNQRKLGTIAALKMVDMAYDVRAYGWFIARVLQLHLYSDLKPLFSDPHMIICSGTVVKEQQAMGVDTSKLQVAATDSPDFTCPADCLRWGLDNHWMSKPVPEW